MSVKVKLIYFKFLRLNFINNVFINVYKCTMLLATSHSIDKIESNQFSTCTISGKIEVKKEAKSILKC